MWCYSFLINIGCLIFNIKPSVYAYMTPFSLNIQRFNFSFFCCNCRNAADDLAAVGDTRYFPPQ